MDIRPVTAVTTGPQGLDALAATTAPPPKPEAPPEQASAPPLEPAVKVDIGTDASKARFIQDRDADAMVFQVVDPASGDVLEQLPSEAALRNRAYDATRAQGAHSASLSRVA